MVTSDLADMTRLLGHCRGVVFAAVTPFRGRPVLLDRWLGTKPIFTIVLTVLALVGHFARFWYAYEAKMRRHEDELRELRSR